MDGRQGLARRHGVDTMRECDLAIRCGILMLTLSLLQAAHASAGMPAAATEHDCERQSQGNVLIYNKCIEISQSAYDDLKTNWDTIPKSAKEKCVREWPMSQPYYYVGLRACIVREIDKMAIEKQKTNKNKFNY
jgi:hypothetical protein